jgi:hypothetical protein
MKRRRDCPDPDGEREAVDKMARELAAKAAPMEVVLAPVTVFQLTALLQVALRHPEMDGESFKTARRFIAGVCAYFDDCPTVLDIIRRGDDPSEDR